MFDTIVIGDLITSTLDNRSSVSHAEMIMKLADNAKGFVRNLDPSNELTVLRMGSKRREVLVAPGKFYFEIFFTQIIFLTTIFIVLKCIHAYLSTYLYHILIKQLFFFHSLQLLLFLFFYHTTF